MYTCPYTVHNRPRLVGGDPLHEALELRRRIFHAHGQDTLAQRPQGRGHGRQVTIIRMQRHLVKAVLEVQHGKHFVALMPLKHVLNKRKRRLIVLCLGGWVSKVDDHPPFVQKCSFLGDGLRDGKGGGTPLTARAELFKPATLVEINTKNVAKCFSTLTYMGKWTLALELGSRLQLYPSVSIRATNNIVLAVGNNAPEQVLFVFVRIT